MATIQSVALQYQFLIDDFDHKWQSNLLVLFDLLLINEWRIILKQFAEAIWAATTTNLKEFEHPHDLAYFVNG